MGLAEFALGQAKSLVKSKLSGPVGTLADLGERLYGRSKLGLGASNAPRLTPAPRHWLNEARGRSDPLLNVFWYCDLPYINGPGSSLRWSHVEEVVLPFVDFDQVSNYRGGKNLHYPNHYNINTLQIKLYEDSQATATQYIYGWQALMMDRGSGLYTPPSVYKKTVHVTVLNVAMLSVMVFEYTGCWPQSVDNLTFTSGNSERLTPTLTLSVDEMNIKFGQFEAGQIPSLMDNVGKDFPASMPKLPSAFPEVFSNLGPF